jgi:hypothetical protein
MEKIEVDVALLQSVVDLLNILSVHFAGLSKKIAFGDRISWHFIANDRLHQTLDFFWVIFKRLVLKRIRSKDHADVDLYRVRLRFVMWSEIGIEPREHLLEALCHGGSSFIALRLWERWRGKGTADSKLLWRRHAAIPRHHALLAVGGYLNGSREYWRERRSVQ